MADIGFYHLTRTPLPNALARLLDRSLQAGQRALVLCPGAGQMKTLDGALWACVDPVWLPHGTKVDGDADIQPVWLSTECVAENGARFLFLVDGVSTNQFDDFDRVFDLFDGNSEDAVAAARDRWRSARASGHILTYWKQGIRGWEKGA